MSYFFENIQLLLDVNTSGVTSGITGIIINTLILIVCNKYIEGVSIKSPVTAIFLAVLIGLFTWILGIFNFGFLNTLTLGLWSVFISTVAIIIADKLLDNVKFASFSTAFIVAIVLAVTNWGLAQLF